MMEHHKRAELFVFKHSLYTVANKFTSSDVERLKFLLTDHLPRQQLEKATKGFDVLCLMSYKGLLLPGDYSFLEELLQEIGKPECMSSFSVETSTLRSLVCSPTSTGAVSHHRPKLSQLKSFLSELLDKMSASNIHDLCLFFCGICEAINHQNAHEIKTAEELFTRLQESFIVGKGLLQPLKHVLHLLGRLDLCASIDAYNAGTWKSQHVHLPTPTEEISKDHDKGS